MSPKQIHRKFRFSENEKVLCYQGPLIYEAKCLQSKVRENEKHLYLLHYSGWNKHWDEWVNETRILKYNDSNLSKQRELVKQYGGEKIKRYKILKPTKNEKENDKYKSADVQCSSTSIGALNSFPDFDKKKMCLRPTEEREIIEITSWPTTHLVKIVIPPVLQDILADDWDLIFRQKLLFHLPAKITVQKILKKYMEEAALLSSYSSNPKEVVPGLQEYFNVMLGSCLLYKFERPQYGDLLAKYSHLSVSQIYGAFHFLRFFVHIGSVLSNQTFLDEKNLKLIVFYVHDCLRYLATSKSQFFDVQEYETAPAEYHRRAMT